ncbi:MAG: YhbY family RNA-binding protein [Gammaproteobacteria bacterium]|nr:YhbY family RNA-binding protein [Gammaproteobacteria bacterium]
MELTSKQRSRLRALAHDRQPVVITGQRGLTPAVLSEIEQALAHHELIKIRLGSTDRDERERMTREICEKTSSAWVQNIGRIAVVYRPAEKPAIRLDDE